jgi:hypothetical protein
MVKPNDKGTIDRSTILIAAAQIGCCPSVAEKILREGSTAARSRVHRERGAQVRAELGFDPEPERAA